MKVSVNFLKDYLKLDISNEELFKKINAHVCEIEVAYPLCEGTNLTIGYVKECVNHPDSDHLHVCQIEVKDGEVLQIVCGAPNMRQGIKVIVALNGAVLSHDFKIKPSKIRGVESNGMCCSLEELGIENKYVEDEFKDGIYILPDEAPIGGNPLDYLYLNDYVYDLELTSNRSDLLSIEGVAYDIGAALGEKVSPKTFKLEETSEKNPLTVLVKTDKCPKYLTRVIKDCKIKKSPLWLRSRLIASGIRPINNVVDITNYVLMELGQPLHSFDYDKLGNKIVVRNALDNETLKTLDNVDRVLSSEDIVITNGTDALCIAGIMGGESTEITNDTKNVVLEAAYFDPLSVRKTSKKLGLKSESSTRFERKIDYERVERALDYAAYLLTLYADGKVLKGVVGKKEPYKAKTVTITKDKINSVLGTSLTKDEVEDIFNRYDYKYSLKGKTYTIEIPSRRMDLEDSYQDIIEDCARLYGYDLIPTNLASTSDQGALTKTQKLIRSIRHYLADLGLRETVTYSLTDPKTLNDFNMNPEEEIKVLMPLVDSMSVMRQSLVKSLLDTIVYNKSRKQDNLAFFEIGKRYSKNGEELLLSGAFEGTFTSSLWQGAKTNVDFFLVKGVLESLFDKLGYKAEYIKLDDKLKNMHPGRSAYIKVSDNIIGYLGEIHPRYAKENSIPLTYVFEINLDKLFSMPKQEFKYESINKYPRVSRDLAIVVKKNVTAKEIVDVITMTSKRLLVDYTIFDLYEGENVASDEKSLAINLVFESKEKTLETEDIDKVIHSILNRLDALLHARLR